MSLKKNPVSPPACVDKPCLCLCFGTLSHTTYSRPLRFTILHASHRRLIAERTCGGGDAERVRGGGSGARSRRRDGDANAGVTPRARGSRDGRNGGARRDARLGRRPSSGARGANVPSSRRSRWRVDPGRGRRHRPRVSRTDATSRGACETPRSAFLDFIAASAESRVPTSESTTSRCQGGTSGFHRYHAFVTIGFPHTRPRVDVLDGPRASARCEAMARYATRHADARTRARAHLCASPTSRRHDFYRRRRRIDGFASSITGASAFFSSSLDRAPSAPSVFARLGTHTPLSARLPTAVNGHDPAEPPSARRSTCCRRIAPRPRAGGKPPRRASARATPRMSSRSRAKPRGRCGRSYTPRSSSEETTCARWRSRSPP